MDKDCIFCKIVSGEAESSIIYEDEDVMAFLDLHPINSGHTLVIPKKHATNIYDISNEDLQKTAKVTQELAVGIKRVLKANGISIFSMNEHGADQDVMHYHVHVIPRYTDDWFGDEIMKAIKKQQSTNPSREELDSIASKLKE